MAAKTIHALLVLAVVSIGSTEESDRVLKISVVTTAGCSDTVRFIRDHLTPTYAIFGAHLEVEFIPWGRTVRNADGSLTCQFGQQDCWANRVHRCALSLLRENQDAQVSYMGCEFRDLDSRPAFLEGSYECAFFSGLNRVPLNRCVSTFFGEPLDHQDEIAAAEPMSVINFVPAIVFNDKPDYDLWLNAYTNLRDTVCKLLSEIPSTGIDISEC